MPTPRLTIRRLMTLVAVAAWFSWLVASILRGSGFVVVMAYFTVLAVIAVAPWSATRGRRRPALCSFLASAAALCITLALMGVLAVNSYRIAYKMMLAMVLLPITAGCGTAWAMAATTPGTGRRVPRSVAWPLVVGLVVLPASMIFSRWPLRAAFLASRPALERLADRVAAGEKIAGPRWAGLIRVNKINRSVDAPKYVGLVIDVHCWLVRTDSVQVAPKVPSPAFDSGPLGDDGRWWFGEYF